MKLQHIIRMTAFAMHTFAMHTFAMHTFAMLIFATLASTGMTHAAPRQPSGPVHWRDDPTTAFAEAGRSNRPVLLWFGAEWCPPCNRLVSGLFTDPAFVAESRNFIAVRLDGDAAGAQVLAEKFGAVGYPTLIVFDSKGVETTRIDAQLHSPEVVLGLSNARRSGGSLDERLDRASRSPQMLSKDDWLILAAYDWEADPVRIPSFKKEKQLQEMLANSAPSITLRDRFSLLYLNAVLNEGVDAKLSERDFQNLLGILFTILPSHKRVVAEFKGLTSVAPALVANQSAFGAGQKLAAMYIAAMRKVRDDLSLPLADRLQANLAVLQATTKGTDGRYPEATRAEVQQHAESLSASARSAAARQAIGGLVSQTFEQVGDSVLAWKYLEADVKRSQWPYYAMTHLAGMAEGQGSNAAAVEWSRRAEQAIKGPTSTVQWSVWYATTLLRLTPEDLTAVQMGNARVLAALANPQVDFYQRNRNYAGRWHDELVKWSSGDGRAAILLDVDAKLKTICAGRADAGNQAKCRQLFGFPAGT